MNHDTLDHDGMKPILIPKGSRAVVTRSASRPFYQAIHCLNTERSEVLMDIFDFLNTASKPARNLFTEIKCEMDFDTNEAVIEKPVNQVAANKRSKAFKELVVAGIVKKIRPNAFMVSPNVIQPSKNDNYINACKKWDILNP